VQEFLTETAMAEGIPSTFKKKLVGRHKIAATDRKLTVAIRDNTTGSMVRKVALHLGAKLMGKPREDRL
jgi:hypothetical protein